MAMRATNVLRGGGKATRELEAITGIKELEAKLKALAPEHPEMARWLQAVVGKASIEMRREMAVQARAAGWGSQSIRIGSRTITGDEAIASIFAFTRSSKQSRRAAKVSALAGLTKDKTMVEWRAGRYPKSPRAKVAWKKLVAMAFATMLEFGTTRMAARPAIRTAVKTARPRVIAAVADGFNAVLNKFSK